MDRKKINKDLLKLLLMVLASLAIIIMGDTPLEYLLGIGVWVLGVIYGFLPKLYAQEGCKK